jgi:uncharacterized protein YhbP (UPF0306 family)
MRSRAPPKLASSIVKSGKDHLWGDWKSAQLHVATGKPSRHASLASPKATMATKVTAPTTTIVFCSIIQAEGFVTFGSLDAICNS